MILGYPKFLRYFGLCMSVLEFAVYRYGISGFHKRIYELYLFSAGVSGHMHILENYFCAFSLEFIYYT